MLYTSLQSSAGARFDGDANLAGAVSNEIAVTVALSTAGRVMVKGNCMSESVTASLHLPALVEVNVYLANTGVVTSKAPMESVARAPPPSAVSSGTKVPCSKETVGLRLVHFHQLMYKSLPATPAHCAVILK